MDLTLNDRIAYMASDDPQFEEKAADIIGLYMDPPQHAAVFCVDEKTAIQALDRLDPVLPLSPGRAEKHGFEYYRHVGMHDSRIGNPAVEDQAIASPAHPSLTPAANNLPPEPEQTIPEPPERGTVLEARARFASRAFQRRCECLQSWRVLKGNLLV